MAENYQSGIKGAPRNFLKRRNKIKCKKLVKIVEYKLSWECHTWRYKLRRIYNSIEAKYGGTLHRESEYWEWGHHTYFVDGGNNWGGEQIYD